jgi:di/tripeptidase
MGLNLRYSPLEWNSKNEALELNEEALTATFTELNQIANLSAQAAKTAPSSVITASAASVQTSVVRTGDIIKTTIAIDLTGLKSTATTGDIIGDTGVSHIGQITTAINGIIVKGNVGCGVVPTTGDDDIDLYSATVGTGAYDGLITDLTETTLMTAAAALAIGTNHPLIALPAANSYLYLTTGNTTAGTYGAGKIIIELWGTVA